MNFFESLQIALKSLWVNKMRSFLTMLGIIIGISSVIAVVSLGTGTKEAITSEFQNYGLNRIIILTNWQENIYPNDRLTHRDYEVIKNKFREDIKGISIDYNIRGSVLNEVSNEEELDVIMYSVSNEYNKIENIEITDGRFLDSQDINSRRHSAVIQEELALEKFGRKNVIGERILVSINGIEESFNIIGLMNPAESLVPENLQQQGYSMYIPYSTTEKILNMGDEVGYIDINLNDDVDIEETKDQIVSVIEKLHNNEGENKYRFETVEGQLDIVQNVLGVITSVVGAIAGISLFVGGIGIMNIMLVSVTERTREIGIRKAIGATRRDILLQFLVESMIISGIGGIIGISLGIGFSKIASLIIGIPSSTNIFIIIVAFLFSATVGIFFGLYPANKAAKLDPIDSLRYE